jgi:hypothetical protein
VSPLNVIGSREFSHEIEEINSVISSDEDAILYFGYQLLGDAVIPNNSH